MIQVFKNKKILLILAVILLLVFLNFLLPGILGNFFSKVSSPIQAVFYTASGKIYNFFGVLSSLPKLKEENKSLKEENLKLIHEVIELKELTQENEALRAQLNLEIELGMKLLMARIIGQEPQNFSRSFLINKGSKVDIKVGMPVLSRDGSLVGKINKVSSSNTSQVLLIIDPNSSINAILQESRATGIVKGKYSLGLLMDLIPQEEKVEKDWVVITSGLGGNFPQGIFIGKVNKVVEQDNEIFKKAWIKPAVNFNHLERVFIILNN